jgi:HSP20 family protein
MRDYLMEMTDMLGRGALAAQNRFDKMMACVPVDVEEDDEKYTVTATVADYKKEDINVEYSNNVLTISGANSVNKDEKDDKTGKYILRERATASFSRSFRLPDVKEDGVNAKMDNGVLTVTLLKAEAPKSSKITIE